MRRLLAFIFALLVCAPSFSAIDAALVGARGASTGSSVSTTGGTVTTGDGLVACISYDPGTTITSISDTAGNTYSLVSNNTGGFARIAAYQVTNATGNASNVLTVNFSGTAYPTAHLIRITDALTSGAYDSGSMVSTTDSTSPYSATTNTLAQAASVVIACAEVNRGGGTNNYTSADTTLLSQENDATTYWTSAVSKIVVASTSAVTASFVKESSSGTNGVIIFAMREDTGGGGGSTKSAQIIQQLSQ